MCGFVSSVFCSGWQMMSFVAVCEDTRAWSRVPGQEWPFPAITLYSTSSDTILSWATHKGAPSEIRALGIPHCLSTQARRLLLWQQESHGAVSTTTLCCNLESKTESVGTGWRLLLRLKCLFAVNHTVEDNIYKNTDAPFLCHKRHIKENSPLLM